MSSSVCLYEGGSPHILWQKQYGDDLSDVNLSELIDFHKKEGNIATITVVKLPNPYGVLEFHEFKPTIISGFKEKPLMPEWINGGYIILKKEIFDYFNEDLELESGVFVDLSKQGRLSAFRHPGFWKSMNTLKDLMDLNEMHENGELDKIFTKLTLM